MSAAVAPAATPVLFDPASFEADQFRVLRHRIERGRERSELAVVAVTSPLAGDGKTTTAINLAASLAQSARVLLIDADLRLGALGARLDAAPDAPGLADAIRDPGVPLDHVARPVPRSNVAVIPAGRPGAPAYETLQSPRCAELFAEARRRFDYVIVDTPPLVPVPDCRVIARLIDQFVLVVRAHRTPRRFVAEALSALDRDKVLGLVLNGADRPALGVYGYYYGYAAPSPRRGFWARLRGSRC